jgi:hypothetical protein
MLIWDNKLNTIERTEISIYEDLHNQRPHTVGTIIPPEELFNMDLGRSSVDANKNKNRNLTKTVS